MYPIWLAQNFDKEPDLFENRGDVPDSELYSVDARSGLCIFYL